MDLRIFQFPGENITITEDQELAQYTENRGGRPLIFSSIIVYYSFPENNTEN